MCERSAPDSNGIKSMFQHFVRPHCHPQGLLKSCTTATFVSNSMVALNTTLPGKTVSTVDENYALSLSLTGVTNNCGFYVVQKVAPVQGYTDMVTACSVGLVLSGLPQNVIVSPFHTSLDMSSAPSLIFNDPTITWLPCGYSSERTIYDATPTATGCSITLDAAFPVENDEANANWFGVGVFGAFGTTARSIVGAISLRQCLDERGTFVPNK